MNIDTVARVGGIFSLLVMLHFVADWVFQSHAEAMAKPTRHWVRARHCFIYTAICCWVITLVVWPSWQALAWMAPILFLSHFFEDTYLPVYVWARYVRKPPEMFPSPRDTQNQGRLFLRSEDFEIVIEAPAPGMKEFKEFASSSLGKILLIAIDQIVHLLFLIPIAIMLVVPALTHKMGALGFSLTMGLAGLCSFGQRKIREVM